MKVVILAGGLGTRLSEETVIKPKPMVEIGGRPILWHIMKIYSHYGFDEFVVCLGYKGYVIKEYFVNYILHQSNVTINLNNNSIEYHQPNVEPWKIHLVDTGDASMTGGRLKRVSQFVVNDPYFFMTYGDAVCDLNISESLEFYKKSNKLAMLTAVRPPARFGNLSIESGAVKKFVEKPKDGAGLVNGGFFILSPAVLDYIKDDYSVWEKEPLESLVSEDQVAAFVHNGFWQPMDTLYEKNVLEELWATSSAPWKVWS